MKTLWKFFLTFLALSVVSWLLVEKFGVEFGQANYWNHHGLFFLVFITFFPRLTLLFSSVLSGGLLWWLSWLFVPRLLIAALATVSYWNQNPILVACSWLIALGGESGEKYYVRRYRVQQRERPMKRVN